MSTSMGLPIASGGRPPANAAGNMGLPIGMSIGQVQGTYGSVASTHPGVTTQNQIDSRAQTAFNVQPHVTVAYRVTNPMPDGARRKDFLFSFHKDLMYLGDSGNLSSGNTLSAIEYNRQKNRSRYASPSGVVIVTVPQINRMIAESESGDKFENSPFRDFVEGDKVKIIGENFLKTPEIMANIFRPLGVYHNRATSDANEIFQMTPNRNISEIISVSKSNHCFVRDVWGIDLYPGDRLGFLYMVCEVQDNVFKTQIVPYVGDWPVNLSDIRQTQEYVYTHYEESTKRSLLPPVYVPIGRVWAAPMHNPFNQGGRSNILSAESLDMESEMQFNAGRTDQKFHSIEVELTPFMKDQDW